MDGRFFLNVIDIAAYNALVLWITRNEQDKSSTTREFLRELGMQLVRGHARERAQQPSGKRRRILEASRRSGLTAEVSSPTSSDDRKRRCLMCPRKLERKTTRKCDVCGSSICKEHTEVLMRCRDCVQEDVNVVSNQDSDI